VRPILKVFALGAISSPAWATTAFSGWVIAAIVLIPIAPALLAGAVGALLPERSYGWSLLAGILLSCALSIGVSVSADGDDVLLRTALYSVPAFVAHLIAYYSCALIQNVIHNVMARRRQEARMAREKMP